MAGLQGQHKGSEPRAGTPAMQARVMRRVQQKPSDGSTHWSCRKLAQELGVRKSTVQRILRQAKLKPHRLGRYMASNDPQFEQKAADIIGRYLNPPQPRSGVFAWMRNPPSRHWTAWIQHPQHVVPFAQAALLFLQRASIQCFRISGPYGQINEVGIDR